MPRKSRAVAVFGDDRQTIVKQDLGGGWDVYGLFRVHRGTPVLVELTVRSSDDESVPTLRSGAGAELMNGIPARTLRRIVIGDLYEGVGTVPPAAKTLMRLDRHDDFRQVARPGRRGRDDLTYAVWAKRYVARCQAGSRRPIADLAEKHSESERAIRDRVHRARERGLLNGGEQGKAGGVLSAKAEKLLEERNR